jgi:hypothetical protein
MLAGTGPLPLDGRIAAGCNSLQGLAGSFAGQRQGKNRHCAKGELPGAPGVPVAHRPGFCAGRLHDEVEARQDRVWNLDATSGPLYLLDEFGSELWHSEPVPG